MIAKTYLMVAPQGESDAFGRAIMSIDLVSGLQKINPQIRVWEQFPDGVWYPGKATGKTCLWIGEPGGESRKITAFNQGAVPEFTQVAPGGDIIAKGWRAIFEKVIQAGAATRAQIETAFKVTLAHFGPDQLCRPCAKNGMRRKHNGGVLRLCTIHENVYRAARELVTSSQQHYQQESISVS